MFVCTAVSCSRLMTGPKKSINYQIKEECDYFKKNTCTYKDRVKIERKQNARPDTRK